MVTLKSIQHALPTPGWSAVPAIAAACLLAGPASAVEFDSVFFVCENHGLLPNDPFFQNNLFYILLWDERRPPRDLASVSSSRSTATSPTAENSSFGDHGEMARIE